MAVASTEEKRAAALAAGSDVAIGYDNLKDAIRSATDGGTDVVIDPVGGPPSESALRALNAGGRLCVLGFASGEIPRLPMNIVLLRNRSIIGVDWGDWSRGAGGPNACRDLLADVLARISNGEIHPSAPQSIPLAEAGRLLRSFGERGVTGKPRSRHAHGDHSPLGLRCVGRGIHTGPQTLTLHRDGTTWTPVPSANVGSASPLTSVSASPGAAIVWAAGYSGVSGSFNPLTLQNG